MKEALVLILVLLLVSVALNVYQAMNAREAQQNALSNNSMLNQVIESKQAEIDTAAGRIQVLKAKVGKDSVEFKVAQNAAKREIQAYRQTIAKLRPLIQAKIDSFPDLREFVAAQDSTIERQDSLLRDTELFCQLQVRDLSKIIELQEQKYEAQKQITAAVTAQLADETREHRKTKRRSALKSVGLGILSVGIVIISLKE